MKLPRNKWDNSTDSQGFIQVHGTLVTGTLINRRLTIQNASVSDTVDELKHEVKKKIIVNKKADVDCSSFNITQKQIKIKLGSS